MNIAVHLRDTKTEEIGVYHTSPEASVDIIDYMFREGNYSCDCNRSLFLARANERQQINEQEEHYPCNTDSNVIVIDKIVDSNTGEVLIADLQDD